MAHARAGWSHRRWRISAKKAHVDTVRNDINVTPLVDVMLVLLIIFMVTAPMLQQGVDVDLPDAKAQAIPDDEGKLVLTVTKDHRYFIGRAEVKLADLSDKVKTNAKLQADKEVYLHADKALPYGDVVEVMAILKDSGIDKLGMISEGTRRRHVRKGKKLHDANCVRCHDTGMYTRERRQVKSLRALGEQLEECTHAAEAPLTDDQKRNVLKYLNEQFYKFK